MAFKVSAATKPRHPDILCMEFRKSLDEFAYSASTLDSSNYPLSLIQKRLLADSEN
jgi:hypothetical protein